MNPSLVSPIGRRAVQQHAKNSYRADGSENQSYAQIIYSKERLNNQRRPKGITIESCCDEKEDNTKQPDGAVGQCFQNQLSRRQSLSLPC